MHIQEDELEKKAEELKELTGQLQDHRTGHQTLELICRGARQKVVLKIDIEKKLTRFIELLVSYTSHFISYYIVLIFIIIIIIVSISISIDRALPMSRPG